jgi:hypothetical protein
MPIASRAVSILFSGLVLAGLTACTNLAEPEGASTLGSRRECFLPRQASGFTPIGNERVLVNVGPARVFELELPGTCLDVDWSSRVGIRSRGGGSIVCQGFDAELLVPGPTGRIQQCPVLSVRRLSDEEVQARRQSRRR